MSNRFASPEHRHSTGRDLTPEYDFASWRLVVLAIGARQVHNWIIGCPEGRHRAVEVTAS